MRARKRNLQPAADAEVVAGAAAGTVAEVGAKKADLASTSAIDATSPAPAFPAFSNIPFNKLEPELAAGDDDFKSPAWRAKSRSKSVNSLSYNEAEEELTRNGSSIDGGCQSED